ncbi:MAG: HPF/RaiA family ribosome-associated protein [Caldilineaceae bacterium]
MTQEFTFEFRNEVEDLSAAVEERLRQDTEERLRQLGQGHNDVIGAAMSLEAPAKAQGSSYLYRANVVVYARPENVAAVSEQKDVSSAAHQALEKVERQIRERREKLQERRRKATAIGANDGLYELSAREIYATYAGNSLPDMWLELSREEIATDLMTNEQLNQGDAYYAADQILAVAQDIVDNPDTQRVM